MAWLICLHEAAEGLVLRPFRSVIVYKTKHHEPFYSSANRGPGIVR